MSFTVRVENGDGDPVSGAKVRISFTAFTRGISDDSYTDGDGRAEFPDYEDGEINVFVDGDNVGTYEYEDGEEITVTI